MRITIKPIAMVSEDQQSLAIGKGGQNVRLAAKLTGGRLISKHPNAPVAEIKRAADAETLTLMDHLMWTTFQTLESKMGPRPSLLDANERI